MKHAMNLLLCWSAQSVNLLVELPTSRTPISDSLLSCVSLSNLQTL